MSDSLQIADLVPAMPKDSSHNPKMMLITAILTAITTIGVSFMSIVPDLRRGDAEAIKVLNQKLSELEKTGNQSEAQKLPDNKLIINGKVMSKDGKQTLSGLDVYFLPEGNNLLTAKTDDSGRFYKEMPPGTYSIIVRQASNGMSGKKMLEEEEHEINLEKLQGATVNYQINRQQIVHQALSR